MRKGAAPAFLAAAALIAATALAPGERAPAVERAHAPIMRPLPPPPSWRAPALDEFPDIVARPVFSPSRRPPLKVEAEPEMALPLPDGRLVGIVVSEGRKVALIEDTSGKSVLRVREGQTYKGWKVADIAAGQIILAHKEIRHALELIKPGDGAAVRKGLGKRMNR